jgi:dienelactone hydrolase
MFDQSDFVDASGRRREFSMQFPLGAESLVQFLGLAWSDEREESVAIRAKEPSHSLASVVVALICLMSSSGTVLLGGPREDFLKLIDRARVPLAPAVANLGDTDGFKRFHFTFAADSSQRVPGIFIEPKSPAGAVAQRRPVVICLHGTGGSKEGCIPQLRELAAKGFLGVAIDGRFHGERTELGSYDDAILRAYLTGKEHPFLYDEVWDVMRLIDYLFTRPDVDTSRIGLIGYSKGGMEAYLAAAVDTRIRVVVSALGAQSFRWALDHGGWSARTDSFKPAVQGAARDAGVWFIRASFVRQFYDRVAPGIYSEFDGPSMLPLIAPRPLLTINGAQDAKTPRPGVMECIASAKLAYASAGASDKARFIIEESNGHSVSPEAERKALEWLERWLKQ